MISQSTALGVAASIFGTTGIAFGVNAILRPSNALEFFEFELPASAAERSLVEYLMIVYGVRDIFMGLAVFATASTAHRKPLGWILLGLSAVAFTDGAVCYSNGHGQWNHWSYAPIVGVIGLLSLGVLDSV